MAGKTKPGTGTGAGTDAGVAADAKKAREVQRIQQQAKKLRAGWVPLKRPGKKVPRMWMPPKATYPIKWDAWVEPEQRHWTDEQKAKWEVKPPYRDINPI